MIQQLLPFRHIEIYQRQTIQPGTWQWLQWEYAGAAQALIEDAARRDAERFEKEKQ